MVLGIYGAGFLGREIMETALDINQLTPRWTQIYYIVDRGYTLTSHFGGETIYVDDFIAIEKDKEAVIAVGEPYAREHMWHKLKANGIPLAAPLIHPGCKVARGAGLGDGTVVSFGAFISFNTNVGANVYIQPNSGVGHDVTIGDNSVISAGVRIAGRCSIGKNTYIGLSVPVRDQMTIGEGVIVSMGSVVQRDIPDHVIAMGNPARAMKENTEHKLF